MSERTKFAIISGVSSIILLCSLIGLIYDVTGQETFIAFIIMAFLSIVILSFGLIFMEKSR